MFLNLFFRYLEYRNVGQIIYEIVPLARCALEKQFTLMAFVQVIYNFVVILPSISINILIPNTIISNDSVIVE